MIKTICVDFGGVLFPTQPYKENLPSDDFRKLKSVVINIFEKVENDIEKGIFTKEMFLELLLVECANTDFDAGTIYSSIVDVNTNVLSILADYSKSISLCGLINEAPKWTELRMYFNDLSLFKKLYISSYTGYEKPDKDAYLHFLDDIGIEAEESLYIDDGEENVLSAKNVGMNTILFKNDDQLEKSLKEIIGS